jgi:hypothetical protein
MQQTPLGDLPEFSDTRREPYGPDEFPDGFRAMTAAEGDALDNLRTVLLFDRGTRAITRWTIDSYSRQWGWRVVLRDRGEIVDSLRLDDVAVVPISATDLAPLLKASLYPLDAQDVLQEIADARAWFHTSDGRYFANDGDQRQHQRMLDEKAAMRARRARGGSGSS